MDDTIVALSSGRPPAGIAVIRLSGSRAHEAGMLIAGALPPPRGTSLKTLSHPSSGLQLDRALILRFDAPHSATGEDIVEFQCHGGRAVVAAVLDAVTSLDGLRLAEPGEFTRRALANGRIDLTEAEGLADLLEAETEMQRRAALAVAGGALSRRIDAWQAVVLSLSARAEAAIDYVGDEDETAIDIAGLRAECVELAEELAGWLARPRAEPLKDGIRVVVAGPPNAGKSSLVNALVGIDRAIVSASPGTTRDSIEVPLAVDGVPLVLVDTAGLRQTDDSVEAMGVARTRAELERAELLLWLGNPADAPLHANRLFVTSKADQPAAHPVHAAISVSAVTGLNLALLLDQIKSRALALLPANDDIPLNQRQADAIAAAHDYLMAAPSDLLVLAETLRSARVVFDRLTGRATIDDVIDALFSRFCLGK